MNKKERIKRVATILFAANGIRNTKIEDIASSMGIAKGGMYYYYKSKEVLLEDIIEDSVLSREEFIENMKILNLSFNDKIKLFIKRRIDLKDDRYNLFLFSKIYENGEINLTKDEYMKKDIFFGEFFDENKKYLKDEYQVEIEKIKQFITASLTRLLTILINQTGIVVKDEESYKKMVYKYSQINLDKEIELFFNLFFKEILK
ncbi:TetR/AcrR family transcriptional regulator [uncultured Cetobacterium sp.]|uniref:TetR/AcrR family transcriptional regulator n=2 Tax=uncultured Cetobacterium sp. TaxID=527638 RepID=UPI002626A747|nr:TetR/AcrR family transcriptional regulator [uncultured Cetobacterium sp.]